MRTPLILALLLLPACSTPGERRHLDLEGRTDTRPYSHTVVAGDTVHVAGTTGVDPETGRIPEDPAQEASLALNGIRAKLALAGTSMDDVVSVQVFCSDLALYETFNRVYRTFFTAPFPARAFIGCGPQLGGARFEITAIAVRR